MDYSNFSNPESNIKALGVHDGMIVADLGAGTGAYTLPLAERVGQSGHVYAVEVQKEFLTTIKNSVAERKLKNVEIIWGDIERAGGTKIRDALADLVVAVNVLFQAEDRKGLIREAKRILKEGGKLLLIDWSGSFKGMGPTEPMVVSPEVARVLCEDEGFVLDKEISAGAHHYGFIFIKQKQMDE